MLPQFLAGSREQYKHNTSLFITWLNDTAKMCGYKPPRHTPKYTRWRKEANLAENSKSPSVPTEDTASPAITYVLPVKQLVEAAQTIANSTESLQIEIPKEVYRAVQSAIDARKRLATWYKSNDTRSIFSNASHDHFITVLERVLEILQPCLPDDLISKNSSAHSSTSKRTPSHDVDNELSNRFGLLDVSYMLDDEESSEDEDVLLKAQHEAQTVKERKQFELEANEFEEYAFAVFCLFEDLHIIEDYLTTVWQKYKDGNLDLITASMTTNAAISLIREAEETLLHQNGGQKEHSYGFLTSLIHEVRKWEHEGRGIPDTFGETVGPVEITEFSEFMYLTTARTLEKFQSGTKDILYMNYPLLISPATDFMFPDQMNLPQNRKWEKEDLFLSQLLMDMSLDYHTVRPSIMMGGQLGKPPLNDQFTELIELLWSDGELTIATVFASRMILNIDALIGGSPPVAWTELHTVAEKNIEMLDVREEGNDLLANDLMKWQRSDVNLINKLYDYDKFWILENYFVAIKKSRLEKCQGLVTQGPILRKNLSSEQVAIIEADSYKIDDPDILMGFTEVPDEFSVKNPIKPNEEPTFLYERNPIFLGTFKMQLQIITEKLNFSVANYYRTIFMTAHLYNALRQTGILNTPWLEMDRVISRHIDDIFGGQLPMEPKDFGNRLKLKMGVSLQQFAADRRPDAARKRRRKDGILSLTHHPAYEILHQYVNDNSTFSATLCKLETIISKANSKKTEKRKQYHYARKKQPIELLAELEAWLPSYVNAEQIDFIALTKRCHMLLGSIRNSVNEYNGERHQKIDKLTDHSGLHQNCIHMLSYILDDASWHHYKEQIIRKEKDKTKTHRAPLLTTVGGVLEAFLKEER